MNTSRTEKILNNARKSANDHSLFEKFPAFLRMYKAWRKGEYQPQKRNIYLSIFALIYLVMPFDFDWVAFIGWVDDFAILGFAFTRLIKEVNRFIDWEAKKPSNDIIDIDAEVK